MRISLIVAFCCLTSAPLHVQENDSMFEIDALTIDVGLLLTCKADVPTYNTFALSLDDAKQGYRARGWKQVESGNSFLAQYQLPKPIDVTDRLTTQTIVFSSSAIMAVIDLKDPTELAKSMGIDDYVSFPGKFMGQRVVSEEATDDAELQMRFTTKVAQSVSTVSSHPGKTLLGCSYRIDTEVLPAKK